MEHAFKESSLPEMQLPWQSLSLDDKRKVLHLINFKLVICRILQLPVSNTSVYFFADIFTLLERVLLRAQFLLRCLIRSGRSPLQILFRWWQTKGFRRTLLHRLFQWKCLAVPCWKQGTGLDGLVV